jgi:hypothetical protein
MLVLMPGSKTQEGEPIPLDVRIRLVELTAQLGEQEADRTWRRFSISLPVQAGLIAIVSYAFSKSLFGLAMSVAMLGCFFAFAWHRIVVFSQFAEARWRQDMIALIDDDHQLADALRSRSHKGPRITRPTTSATDNARTIVVGVGLFWLVLAGYCVTRLL